MTSRAAVSANAADTGLAFTFQMLSSAWLSASRPVLMVMPRGRPVVSSGSTSATSG